MKNLKFHSILNYRKDVLEKKLSSIGLINLLVDKKVLVKSNIDKSENVKSLNRLHSPSDGNDDLMFATIIFDKATYFLSDDFIEEAVDFILQNTKKSGEKLLIEKTKEYTIRNEGFFSINQKKEFFGKELNIQIGKKITLTKYFEIEDYNENEGVFSQKTKDYLKHNLHSNSDFNSRYVFGFNSLNQINLSVYFDNLKELVYVQRLIDIIKFEIGLKDLKNSKEISFTTHDDICSLLTYESEPVFKLFFASKASFIIFKNTILPEKGDQISRVELWLIFDFFRQNKLKFQKRGRSSETRMCLTSNQKDFIKAINPFFKEKYTGINRIDNYTPAANKEYPIMDRLDDEYKKMKEKVKEINNY